MGPPDECRSVAAASATGLRVHATVGTRHPRSMALPFVVKSPPALGTRRRTCLCPEVTCPRLPRLAGAITASAPFRAASGQTASLRCNCDPLRTHVVPLAPNIAHAKLGVRCDWGMHPLPARIAQPRLRARAVRTHLPPVVVNWPRKPSPVANDAQGLGAPPSPTTVRISDARSSSPIRTRHAARVAAPAGTTGGPTGCITRHTCLRPPRAMATVQAAEPHPRGTQPLEEHLP